MRRDVVEYYREQYSKIEPLISPAIQALRNAGEDWRPEIKIPAFTENLGMYYVVIVPKSGRVDRLETAASEVIYKFETRRED